MCEASYLSSDGSYGVISSDEPVQKTSKGPAITAIVLGTLALLSFGGLGVTGLLQSYEVIHLSPSWFLNVIETLGGASPFPGLWAITGVGVLGGFSLMWGICQMHKFNKEAEEIQNGTKDMQNKRNTYLADFSTTPIDWLINPTENTVNVYDPKIINTIPVNCYAMFEGRQFFACVVNDNSTIYYLMIDGGHRYTECKKLYDLGFHYYDIDTRVVKPEGPFKTLEELEKICSIFSQTR
jgi:hypothetical protein